MKPRARRARKVIRDRRRHYDGAAALCPQSCIVCAQSAPDRFTTALKVFDMLTTLEHLRRLVMNPDAPQLIREATEAIRSYAAAARGEMAPLEGPVDDEDDEGEPLLRPLDGYDLYLMKKWGGNL